MFKSMKRIISGQYCRRALDMKWLLDSAFIWAMY